LSDDGLGLNGIDLDDAVEFGHGRIHGDCRSGKLDLGRVDDEPGWGGDGDSAAVEPDGVSVGIFNQHR